ncbi:uncharacterized protein KZ484_026539 [Pholidichthys leucotaenia]
MAQAVLNFNKPGEPYIKFRHHPLSTEEALVLLKDEAIVPSRLPVRARGGELYVIEPEFYCNNDWRADGHRWEKNGTSKLPRSKPVITKTYFYLKLIDGIDKEFTKSVYVLHPPGKRLVIHYMGDDSLCAPSDHGSKQSLGKHMVKMSSVQRLRGLIRERLAAAAEEICREFEEVIVQYEEEIQRQHRLLDIRWNPKVELHSKDLPHHHGCKEDEVVIDQHLWNQERNSILDQEEPELPQMKDEQEELGTSQEGEVLAVKLEASAFMEAPVDEENSQNEAELISELRDEEGSQQVDSGSAKEEEPRTKKRRLRNRSRSNGDDCSLTSKTLLKKEMDAPQPLDCNEKEVVTVQHLWNQEGSSILDLEVQDAAQVKVEEQEICTSQEKEQTELKQETDSFMVTHTFKENNSETESTSVQLLSYSSPEKESKNQGAGKNVNPGSSKREETRKETQIILHRSHRVDDICGTTVCQRQMLSINTRIHRGARPCSCKACGQSFTHWGNLKRHMKFHKDEKQYSCEICGKGFNQSGHLKTHMRIHTGERPYCCEACGKSFCQFSNLKKAHEEFTPVRSHILVKHVAKVLPKAVLETHMKIHTGEKPYSCENMWAKF